MKAAEAAPVARVRDSNRPTKLIPLGRSSAKCVKPVVAQAYGLECRPLERWFLLDKIVFHACPWCRSKNFLPIYDPAADLRACHLQLHTGIGATFYVLNV